MSLLTERSKGTQKILRNVINLIRKIPSQKDLTKQFNFLQAISEIDESIIKLAIHKFTQKERYASGKGFQYLKTMIIDMNENKDKLLELEIKQLGRTPTKKKVKKKEYNNVYSTSRRNIVSS